MTSRPYEQRLRRTPVAAVHASCFCDSVGGRAMGAALAVTVAACDYDGRSLGERPCLEVRIASPLGSPPSSYRVVVSDNDSQVWLQDCPGPSQSEVLECTPEGFAVRGERSARQITVKAPGCAWHSLVLHDDPNVHELSLELEALEPFEASEDYATGFGTFDAFDVFAVPVDTELGISRSVKFLLTDLRTLPRVYLQNTREHPLHYDFARTVLGMPLSLPDFERAAHSGAERDILAGTLVAYPELEFESQAADRALRAPIALSFFPSDDVAPAQVLTAHRLLEERLLVGELGGAERRLVYLPAGERQELELGEARGRFADQDALWTELAELYLGVDEQVLNPGLAYGRLRLVSPEGLGRVVLSFEDIVVLTRLPNDLPLVGGTITAELQTPLAHVNVAARARGTPNLALRGADSDPRIAPLIGRMVRFEVTTSGFTLTEATEEEARDYWNSLTPASFIPPSDVDDHGLPGFEDVGFAGSSYCGPKAANLSELHELLGEEAPYGFVVPFWAYDQHMRTAAVTAAQCEAARSDCLEEGRDEALCHGAFDTCTVAAEADDSLYGYAQRLLGNEAFLGDTALREASLDSLAHVVSHLPVDEVWATKLDARVAEVFGSAQVRLRSSTNAEDLPNFSGAGLYESVSAFSGGNERASSRIRKVWASVWGFQAFEERKLWGIDHLAVRMGVAVSPAVDDEAANGVLVTQNIANPGVAGMYVNVQQGELGVTNPENGALPEVFSILPSPNGGVQVARQRSSSLSPDQPLLSDGEVSDLYAAAARVQAHFAPLYEVDPSVLALELEFKFRGSERSLLIKQARPYATRDGLW